MNTWEQNALQYHYSDDALPGESHMAAAAVSPSHEPMIFYPGLYSATGFNPLEILFEVRFKRENPVVDVGPVDMDVCLVICDLVQPDQPIVYVTPAFLEMTGYSEKDVMGRNCRFLQVPGGRVSSGSARKFVSEKAIKKMRKSVERNLEVQLEVVNFKKNGQRFINMLAMIPVYAGHSKHRYSVGFLYEKN